MDKNLNTKNSIRFCGLIWKCPGDPAKDVITEVAAIITDWDFNEIDSFTGVIRNRDSILKKRFKANGAFWDANPEARDGLLNQK